MRVKFTISLLILNLLAFGAILFLGHKSQLDTSSQSSLASIIGKEVAEAERIEIRGDLLEAPRVLEREGSTWKMSAPMEWSANFYAVNRILNQLQFLEEEASFTIEEIEKTGQSLADYGLENPALTLTIRSNQKDMTLRIGAVTKIGNNVYILGPSGDEIFVVSGQSLQSLIVDLSDLRTREIFDIPVFEVKGMTVQINAVDTNTNGGLKVRLAKNSEGWTFESPLNAQADPAVVGSTINTLTATKVERFIEPEATDSIEQGLENPFMRVTLDGNKRRQTLLIGNSVSNNRNGPSYYAKLEQNPTIFTVSAAPFDELKKAQEAMRERNFMQFDPSTLTSINISEKGFQIRLQKLETGEWQVIESKMAEDIQPYRVDTEIIKKLKNDLKTLRATDFTIDAPNASDLERLGFNSPRREVKLTTADKKEITLQLAHPEDENDALYARKTSTEYIYQVDRRTTLQSLPLSALYYRNRTLDALPEAARVSSIRLTDLSTDTVLYDFSLPNSTSLWLEVLAKEPLKEQAALLQLIEQVRKFTVQSYVADQYTDAYEVDIDKSIPWTYALDATILLPGGDTNREDTRRYVFTERLSGTMQIGASQAQNAVFQLPKESIDAIYELTENMPLPPEASGDPVPDPILPEPISPVTPETTISQ